MTLDEAIAIRRKTAKLYYQDDYGIHEMPRELADEYWCLPMRKNLTPDFRFKEAREWRVRAERWESEVNGP